MSSYVTNANFMVWKKTARRILSNMDTCMKYKPSPEHLDSKLVKSVAGKSKNRPITGFIAIQLQDAEIESRRNADGSRTPSWALTRNQHLELTGAKQDPVNAPSASGLA